MSRRKKPALDVPTSDADAMALICRYVGEERRLRGVAEFADSEIAVIAPRRDRDIAAAAPVQTERFAAIKAWWEAVGKARFAGPKKRSAEIAGAKIGTRLGMPQVKLPKGVKAQDIIDWLKGAGAWAAAFVRQKEVLDKEAIIEVFTKPSGLALATKERLEEQRIRVIQVDEFYIDAGPPSVPAELAEPD